MLAPRIAGLLGRPRARVRRGLLALPERRLLDGGRRGGARSERAGAVLERSTLDADRERLRRGRGPRALCRTRRALPAARCESWPTPRGAVLQAAAATRRSHACATEPAVAMVGTRQAEPLRHRGRVRARARAGAAGVPVVSGLALGIDATAHRGCLDGGGDAGGGAGVRAGRRLPAPPPRRCTAGARGGAGAVGAAARARAVPLELPGAQPDHGRAGADDAWWSRPRIRAAA